MKLDQCAIDDEPVSGCAAILGDYNEVWWFQQDSPPLSPDGVVVAPLQRLETIGKQQSAPANVMSNQYNQTYVNNQFNNPKDKAWASFDDDSQGNYNFCFWHQYNCFWSVELLYIPSL